jgi:hypothetical protein
MRTLLILLLILMLVLAYVIHWRLDTYVDDKSLVEDYEYRWSAESYRHQVIDLFRAFLRCEMGQIKGKH